MSAALPRPERAISADPAVPPPAALTAPQSRAPAPVTPLPQARLADELAIPAPSPVHQLQAELVQLIQPADPAPEPMFPGWFRLGFPVASSILLWAMILWGASRFA